MNDKTNQLNVEKETLEQMLVVGGKTLVSNCLLALLLCYMQARVLPLWLPVSWVSTILGVNLIRYFISRYYLKHQVNTLVLIRKRLNVFRIGLLIIAGIWSTSSFFVYEQALRSQHIEQLLFVAYMLAGLSAGGAVAYSRDVVSALAFTSLSVFPMLISFAFSGHPILVAMSVAGLLYMIFITVSIRAHHQSLIEGSFHKFQAIKHASEVEQLAFYDELTKLPNRRLFLEKLEHAFVQSWRTGKQSALLFLDLDGFKRLNDTEGHDMGDMLLMQVANRLKDSVRKSDTVSRFGGDEFVVLLENLNEDYSIATQEVQKLIQLILANLNQPYQLINVTYSCTASIGIAMLGEHGRTQQDLLKHADIAMYKAKNQNGNQAVFYDANMQVD